jgi:hypothetical protein
MVILTLVSVYLGKSYLSEREERLRQEGQNTRVINELQNQNAQLLDENTILNGGELHRLRTVNDQNNQVINELQNRNAQLLDENTALGGNRHKLLRLKEINDRIANLQNQIIDQRHRDADAEAEAEARERNAAEDIKLTIHQNIEFDITNKIAGLQTQIIESHNEFLTIEMNNIRAELQLVECQRHTRVMEVFFRMINIPKQDVDIRILRERALNEDGVALDELQEIEDRMTRIINAHTYY